MEVAGENKKIDALIVKNIERENYFRNTTIPQLFVDGDMVLRKFTPPAMNHFNLSISDIGKPITAVHDNFRFPTLLDNITEVIE